MTLRFVKLELHEVRIPFRFHFKHALADRSEARSLIVVLRTDTGHVGYGEAVPREYLTGETVQSAWDDIVDLWWPRLRELRFENRAPLSPQMQRALDGDTPTGRWEMKPGTTRDFFDTLRPLYDEADHARRTAGYAAIDVAAVDAWARATGRAGCSLFGQPPASHPLTAPLGSLSAARTRLLTRLFRLLGFRQFKLKVGTPYDHNRVAAARSVLGSRCDLRVDANAAWTPEQAIGMLRRWREYRVSSAEQPVPATLPPEDLARVEEQGGVPVMPDESLCTRADAEALAQAGVKRVWNVRLAKIGGFSGMLEICRLARENFCRLHLGVLVGETSLLTAAQRACFGLADFSHVEYGFPRVLLKGDPFRGGPGGYLGHGRPLSSAPGLGVRLLPGTLARVTVRRIELG